jgi:hypothetical protein
MARVGRDELLCGHQARCLPEQDTTANVEALVQPLYRIGKKLSGLATLPYPV